MPRHQIDTIKKIKRVKRVSPNKKLVRLLYISLSLLIILSIGYGAPQIKAKKDALGIFKQGKYLVLFQNNAEIRPTGGFIGSFAVVEFDNYKIKKIDFNTNIYKLDNTYTLENTVIPPEPLAKISNGKWAMRDANFAVDFGESARQVQWFYEKESNQKVDGVIAVNASVIQEILKLTGPINLTNYDTTISADNYFNELATKIEKDYFLDKSNKKENEPKTILKDLMPILFERALKQSKISLFKLIYRELSEKQILFYANNSKLESKIAAQNWGGLVKETNGDYLQINNANITDTLENINAGAKTSFSIEENINYTVNNINSKLTSNLTLTRKHNGSYEWPDGVNMNWTKVLVSKGAFLQSAKLNNIDIKENIIIGEEAGKTTFGLWINTAPQTENILNLQYVLPISADKYHLLVQKQPGNLGDDLKVTFMSKELFNGLLNKDLLIK